MNAKINIGNIKNTHLRRLCMIPTVPLVFLVGVLVYAGIGIAGAVAGAVDAISDSIGDGMEIAAVIAECWRKKS
jgi:hypothetical protein